MSKRKPHIVDFVVNYFLFDKGKPRLQYPKIFWGKYNIQKKCFLPKITLNEEKAVIKNVKVGKIYTSFTVFTKEDKKVWRFYLETRDISISASNNEACFGYFRSTTSGRAIMTFPFPGFFRKKG